MPLMNGDLIFRLMNSYKRKDTEDAIKELFEDEGLREAGGKIGEINFSFLVEIFISFTLYYKKGNY